jgi:hypothetical protein
MNEILKHESENSCANARLLLVSIRQQHESECLSV